MISWKAILLVTLFASQGLAGHAEVRHAHARHAQVEKRSPRHNRRASVCHPPSSLSASASASTVASSTTHTTSSTTTKTTTSTTSSKQAASTSSSNKSSSNSGSSSSGSSKSSSGSSITSVQAASGYTPNGKKAGTSSGDCYSQLQDHLGWWYDWTPQPAQQGSPVAVPMLWGGGGADSQDSSRLAQFKKITQAPTYMLAFEEPDCPSGGGSAGMSVSDGVQIWEQYIAPFHDKGTKLGSPSMCKQAAETWLKQFSQQISTPWDFTNIHVNKNSMTGVKADLDHYAQYGKPIWVSEFACVDDQNGFTPCEDQGEIDQFINDIVALFEADSRVAAYAYSNGEGLGSKWPLCPNGVLNESGKTYLAAISNVH